MTNGRESIAAPWAELKTRLAERGVRVLWRDLTTFRVVATFLGVPLARCVLAFATVDAWTPEFIERVAVATDTPPQYWATLRDRYARRFRQTTKRNDGPSPWERQYREYCDAQ